MITDMETNTGMGTITVAEIITGAAEIITKADMEIILTTKAATDTGITINTDTEVDIDGEAEIIREAHTEAEIDGEAEITIGADKEIEEETEIPIGVVTEIGGETDAGRDQALRKRS
jgi:hypothetical protein